MDEDYALEDELRERYRRVRIEVESLEARRASLRDELHGLAPHGTGDPRDALIHQYGEVAGVAHHARAELEGLAEGLKEALEAMTTPVVSAHENTRGLVTQRTYERDWERTRRGA